LQDQTKAAGGNCHGCIEKSRREFSLLSTSHVKILQLRNFCVSPQRPPAS
jgi:hypothetical protein